MSPRRLVAGTTAVVGAAFVVGGCAAPASRYRSDAVDFIRGDTMFQAYSVDFQDIECGEPDTTDEGATLACVATDPETGQAYTLTFTIVGKNELQLTDIAFAGAADGGSSSSAPASSATDDTSDTRDTSEPASSPPLPTAPPVGGADAATTAPATTAPATTAPATTAPVTAASAATTAAVTVAPTTAPAATTTTPG